MNTKRNPILPTILAVALLVSMAGTAFATYAVIVPTPFNQTIGVGTIGVYTITIYTGVSGEHTLMFDTNETLLYANLTGPNGGDANGQEHTTSMNTTGNIVWTASSSKNTYEFTYEVWPQNGITCGDYPMEIINTGVDGTTIVTATATPSGSVVPELPTFAFVGIGLIGLVALGRRKR